MLAGRRTADLCHRRQATPTREQPGSVALVFDGTGQVRWSEPRHQLGGFSPDGTELVTATVDGDNDVTVWFLDPPSPSAASMP